MRVFILLAAVFGLLGAGCRIIPRSVRSSTPDVLRLVEEAFRASEQIGPASVSLDKYSYSVANASKPHEHLDWFFSSVCLYNDQQHWWSDYDTGAVSIYVRNGPSILSYDLTDNENTYQIVHIGLANRQLDSNPIVSGYLRDALQDAKVNARFSAFLAGGHVTSETYCGTPVWHIRWDVTPQRSFIKKTTGNPSLMVSLIVQKSDFLPREIDAYDAVLESMQREVWSFRRCSNPYPAALFTLRPPKGARQIPVQAP